MVQDYREEDGMDPGLGELAYDGTEYELDEFGERIGSEDSTDDMAAEEMPEDAASAEEMTPDSKVEQGFGETLKSEDDPLSDQLQDDQLSQEAEADYAQSEATREPEGNKDM